MILLYIQSEFLKPHTSSKSLPVGTTWRDDLRGEIARDIASSPSGPSTGFDTGSAWTSVWTPGYRWST